MKKILVLLVAVCMGGGIFAQGIKFEHSSFTEALAKAKKENKMVFMDCYTSWCGPCKMLAKNVFPQKEVGDYFNQLFVNIKIDMEKGEGPELKKRYQVEGFPTLLFLDSEGNVLHKKIGGSDAQGLIAEAKIAADPSQRMATLDKKYARGDRSEAFIAKYAFALYKARKIEDMKRVCRDYVVGVALSDLNTKDGFIIISGYKCEYQDKIYKHLMNNKAMYVALVGEQQFGYVINEAATSHLSALADKGTLEELKSELKKFPELSNRESRFISQYYMSHKEYDNWFDYNVKNADKVLATDKRMGLSTYISFIYRITLDPNLKALYAKAIEAAVRIEHVDENFPATQFCLASLYQLTGQKEKALKYINMNLEASKDKEVVDPRIIQLKEKIENM